MNEQPQVDSNKVIDDLLEQLKQANLQIAVLRVMLNTANSTPSDD